MKTINRREFLKRTRATLAWMALACVPVAIPPPKPDKPDERLILQAPPTSFGRIATWWRQTVHSEPSPDTEQASWKTRDEIIPLYASTTDKAPWSRNPIWHQTTEGFIHSGYVQPVENTPNSDIVIEGKPGFWARVCVPIAEARGQPNSEHVGRESSVQHANLFGGSRDGNAARRTPRTPQTPRQAYDWREWRQLL
ncbi:MAG: hypothetical protein V3S14_09075 [Anaerolineae bacterium]